MKYFTRIQKMNGEKLVKIVTTAVDVSTGSNDAERYPMKIFGVAEIGNFYRGKLLGLAKRKEILFFTKSISDKIKFHLVLRMEIIY
jgi:hypothetical protein